MWGLIDNLLTDGVMHAGDLSAADISESEREELRNSIARDLNLDPQLVKIASLGDARRRLLAVALELEVLAADVNAASEISARGADLATSVLSAVGADPSAGITVASTVEAPDGATVSDESSASPIGAIVGGVVAGTLVVVLMIYICRKRKQPETTSDTEISNANAWAVEVGPEALEDRMFASQDIRTSEDIQTSESTRAQMESVMAAIASISEEIKAIQRAQSPSPSLTPSMPIGWR